MEKKKELLQDLTITEGGIKNASEQAYFVDYTMEGRTWEPANDDWSEWGTSVADMRWVRMPWASVSKATEAVRDIINYKEKCSTGSDGISRQGRASGCIKIWRQDLLAKEVSESDVEAARRKLKRLEDALEFNKAGNFTEEEPAWTIEDVEYGSRYADYSRMLSPELGEDLTFPFDDENETLRRIAGGFDAAESLGKGVAVLRYKEAVEGIEIANVRYDDDVKISLKKGGF